MTTIHAVRQQIEALRVEARGLVTAAGDAAMPADAETRFASIEARVAELRATERRLAFVDSEDRNAQGTPLDAGDRQFNELRNSVSLSAVIRAQLRDTSNTAEAGRVRELSQEVARRSGRSPANGLLWDMRAMTTGKQGTPANGAALVPLVQRPDQFIDVLRNNLVIERSGARVLTDLQGDIAIPKRVTPVTPAFVTEQQALPLSDGSYAQLKMTPKTAGVVSEISRNLVLQSSPSVEALVMDDQAKTLAQLIDLAALSGNGTGANPLGVIPQATAQTYAHGGAPSWDNVLGTLSTLEGVNVQPNAWVIGAGVRRKLMETPRSATLSLGYVMEDANQLAGLPVLQTGNVVPGSLLIGAWDELMVGYWSAVEIVVNEFAQDAFMRGSVLVRAIVSMDVLVRRPDAFVSLTEAAA